MKFKFPILIAAGLLMVFVSKAQYGNGYVDNRINIHGRVIIPGRTPYQIRYDNHRDWRAGERDWRADEYERFCRDHREYRGGREAYYRDRSGYRPVPYCAPRRVVVCGY
jgi:hypothetical protein